MPENPVIDVMTGLALIIPGILLLRWILTRVSGSPDDWGQHLIDELNQRYAQGKIDEESYRRRLKELTEE